MFLNGHPPIAGGRELWGFPKKLAWPELRVEEDTRHGVLKYVPDPVAVATMGYNHRTLALESLLTSLSPLNFLMKIIPHVDGSPRICELVRSFMEDITVKGAWEGPAAFPTAAVNGQSPSSAMAGSWKKDGSWGPSAEPNQSHEPLEGTLLLAHNQLCVTGDEARQSE
jgi:hypothetical protein